MKREDCDLFLIFRECNLDVFPTFSKDLLTVPYYGLALHSGGEIEIKCVKIFAKLNGTRNSAFKRMPAPMAIIFECLIV
jgi:hypothetical protein